MLFTVILLIGSGWSTLKQMVNAGEKKLIFAVLIGQIVLNISMVVVEETAPQRIMGALERYSSFG
jgi:hypothetical protein